MATLKYYGSHGIDIPALKQSIEDVKADHKARHAALPDCEVPRAKIEGLVTKAFTKEVADSILAEAYKDLVNQLEEA